MNPTPLPTVRALTPSDAAAYVALRRAMLLDTPRAFAADPETDRGSDEAGVRTSLAGPGYAIVGAFEGEALIGAAGIIRQSGRKLMHRAYIWGVWVRPDRRGRGIGEQLVRRTIETARGWSDLRVLCLSANAEQPAAIRLYERVGFKAWGVEPAMLIVDGVEYGEVHMQLRVRSG
ncbi:MAG: GNAT family N-acetyltransferase [Phycisphaerales bacterium]|nr:GNAT family N-acetyltransferase [Phycisphaerales bacterium]